jgi:hypothetical protein
MLIRHAMAELMLIEAAAESWSAVVQTLFKMPFQSGEQDWNLFGSSVFHRGCRGQFGAAKKAERNFEIALAKEGMRR